MRKQYGDRVEFLAVYLREAHPVDGARSESNDRVGIVFKQPLLFEERKAIAKQCSAALQIKMPVIVDEMDDRVGRAYNAMPDRLFLIDQTGRVVYRGSPGPFGYNPNEMEQALIMLLLDKPAESLSGGAPEPPHRAALQELKTEQRKD